MDEKTCNCICPYQNINFCPADTGIDKVNCRCVFKPRVPPSQPTCKKTCSGRFVLDPKTCSCVCPWTQLNFCPADVGIDKEKCQCVYKPAPPIAPPQPVCLKACSGRFVLDPKTCTCVCPSDQLNFCPVDAGIDKEKC